MKRRKVGNTEYYEGSTNVYADLGYANPEEWSLKASIATKLLGIIEENGLTQKNAGTLLGIAQGRVSDLKRGQFGKFSVEKLLTFLNALDRDVDIVIRPKVEEVAHITVSADGIVPGR